VVIRARRSFRNATRIPYYPFFVVLIFYFLRVLNGYSDVLRT
jgi:hypothetical protein